MKVSWKLMCSFRCVNVCGMMVLLVMFMII